ncbi:MAG: dynamin family protein [Deltaproteobacteria bacterium]|nr:dynamin family protein [Deltaproteobacteria bacterium]
MGQDAHAGFEKLRRDVPRLVETLHLGDEIDILNWSGVVDKKLLPRLAGDFPLVAAICGGGSSGKSTLFNALIGEHVSPTGGTAGINRRVLAAVSKRRFGSAGEFQTLLEPFGYRPQPLADKHDLASPGDLLYVLKNKVPPNLILLDTPDFDTGLKGAYTNREMTRQALELSDIFIYIFTNANYNNRDNTDFVSEMLSDIGRRKCYLVYRVYASYGDQEILGHARTVAGNLYGKSADEYVLGIYRADEDNRVAADEKFMALGPVDGKTRDSLTDELERMDTAALRSELVASVYEDALTFARDATAQARDSRERLCFYRDVLQAAQSVSVQDALQHLPLEPVLKRFTDIWYAGDPGYLKVMRKTGRFVDAPLRAAVSAAKWITGKKRAQKNPDAHLNEFPEQFEEDLLVAVNNLRRQAVGPELSVALQANDPAARAMVRMARGAGSRKDDRPGERVHAQGASRGKLTFTAKTHTAITQAQEKLKTKDWQTTLDAVVADGARIADIPGHIDGELRQLAAHFRETMGFISRVRQTFSALLTVLPATAAMTYILTTGDPVGAVGIKVKLAGLFGLKDLYALVAIPATTGLNRADRKQLEFMLVPITRTWLNDKLGSVQSLFEKEITGEIIAAANQALDASRELIDNIEDAMKRLNRER